jgi:hypothetical protein
LERRALPAEDTQELVRYLPARLNAQAGDARFPMEMSPEGHGILDIAPVHLGRVLQLLTPDDDLLGEMLEGRA